MKSVETWNNIKSKVVFDQKNKTLFLESNHAFKEISSRIAKLISKENWIIEKLADDDSKKNNDVYQHIKKEKAFYFSLLDLIKEYDKSFNDILKSFDECVPAYFNGAKILEQNKDVTDILNVYYTQHLEILEVLAKWSKNANVGVFMTDLAKQCKQLSELMDKNIKKYTNGTISN